MSLSRYKQEDLTNHLNLFNKWVFLKPKTLQEFMLTPAPNVLDFSQHKKRIAIWTGPAWEPWNRTKVDEGMAGSETWAAYLARAFVKRGYDVTVYNDLLAPTKSDVVVDPVVEAGTHYGDVRYIDYTKLFDDIRFQYIDYFISSRNTDPLKNSLHAGKHYVMIHDVWLSPDPNYDVVAWKTQGYAYLSEWHKQFLQGHHKQLPPEKMFMTANGIVPEWYEGVTDEDKINMSVYSSSPDRGLYQLLQMMPEIRKAVPDFTLKVAYGFYNWEEAVKKRNDQRGMAFIAKIKQVMDQPGVAYLGRVDKKTLAECQKKAKVWLYPTWFDETFCCGAAEAGFSHNAILSTDRGGLKTTVGSAGILLPTDGLSMDGEYPKSYVERFTAEAIKLLTDEGYRRSWADKAREKMSVYTWDRIADDWLNRFKTT